MQQARDFQAECEALFQLIRTLNPEDYSLPTAFKEWTTNDVLVHLHFWNGAADLSLTDGDALVELVGDVFKAPSLRSFENNYVKERGEDLLEAWYTRSMDMAERWAQLDPKMRVKWAGPDMSVRSSITARQMEHWAHGQEVFDLFGKERVEDDRIKNIVFLGVNTFGWSFKVRKAEPSGAMPQLKLAAPSGEVWIFGEQGSDCIEGNAVEFCQVVTQTRNIADTSMEVTGETATEWMATAQCFAGGPETPPAPGTRIKQNEMRSS